MGNSQQMPEPIEFHYVYWGSTTTHPTQAQVDDSRARYDAFISSEVAES